MFGKKENDGFLDGFARTMFNWFIAIAVVSFIWYVFVSIILFIITKPIKFLIWVCVIIGFIWIVNWHSEKYPRPEPKSVPTIYDQY